MLFVLFILLILIMALMLMIVKLSYRKVDKIVAFRTSKNISLFKEKIVKTAKEQIDAIESPEDLSNIINDGEACYRRYYEFGLGYCNKTELNDLAMALLKSHFAHEKLKKV